MNCIPNARIQVLAETALQDVLRLIYLQKNCGSGLRIYLDPNNHSIGLDAVLDTFWAQGFKLSGDRDYGLGLRAKGLIGFRV